MGAVCLKKKKKICFPLFDLGQYPKMSSALGIKRRIFENAALKFKKIRFFCKHLLTQSEVFLKIERTFDFVGVK